MPIKSMLSLFFILLLTSVNGQQNDSKLSAPAPVVIGPPISVIPTSPVDAPIEIKQFHIHSEVHGNLAETKIDITFYNPNQRTIAADFMFPVPNQGIISSYALDVNGVMVDGVAVEKQKARVVFEKIVRQGIDPGLVEKVTGNLFKTRIFPLNSKQSRRIQISYVAVLQKSKAGYLFDIPLMQQQAVSDFSLKIEVMNSLEKPIISSANFKNIEFSNWKNAYITEFKKPQITLDQVIQVVIPELKEDLALIGKNQKDQFHFAINPKLPVMVPPFRLAPINQLKLVWDASHSRRFSDHKSSFALLEAFFKKYQSVDVELFWLRNELKHAGNFSIKKGQWQALKTLLTEVQYDGGTQLSSMNQLPVNTAQTNHINGITMLFSDGVSTFGLEEKISTQWPLHVFSSELTQNHAFNRMLAQRNLGAAYQLSAHSNIAEIIRLIPLAAPQLSAITILDGEVSGLPELPMTYDLIHNQPITGQLLSETAQLKLNFTYYGREAGSQVIQINQNDAFDSTLLEVIAASQQLAFLQQRSEYNKQHIINLSQQYGFASDHTSLLVLESLEQYVEHQVAPPKSLPTIRKQYLAQLKTKQKNTNHALTNKINAVVELWEKRKVWWQKDFPVRAKIRKPITDSDRVAPDPPRMSVAQPEAYELEEQGEITVTGSRIRGSEMDLAAPVEKKAGGELRSNPSVKIAAWDPQTPYLDKLKETELKNRVGLYYQMKVDYLHSPAFYFDCANFFFDNNQTEFGLQVLSNIAEIKILDSRLLRTMAMMLSQHQYLNLSIETHRKVLADRAEEPQSYRDLGLALMKRADQQPGQQATADYQQALNLLYQVITQEWDRFNGVEATVLMELNRLIVRMQKLSLDTSVVDSRLLAVLDVDVRITLSWDSDLTDIDLWVIEPNGEKVSYDNTLSASGGLFHQDYTQGYGPEEYLIKRAPSGKYTVKVHFYGNGSPELTGATTLYVNVYTHYGRPQEAVQSMSLRLENTEDQYMVGSIEF